MSYADLGTLKKYLMMIPEQKISEDDARPIIHQLLEAIADMHRKLIVHRDIKPDNILIKSSNKVRGGRKVCLADFGIACLITDESLTKQLCGTPGFIDPYILNPPIIDSNNPNPQSLLTLKSDIFSIGSVFFGLVAGMPLIQGEDIHIEEVLIKNKEISD